MAETPRVYRIYRSQDIELAARTRELTSRSVRFLKDNPTPDTFLGRKTQEPPKPEERE